MGQIVLRVLIVDVPELLSKLGDNMVNALDDVSSSEVVFGNKCADVVVLDKLSIEITSTVIEGLFDVYVKETVVLVDEDCCVNVVNTLEFKAIDEIRASADTVVFVCHSITAALSFCETSGVEAVRKRCLCAGRSRMTENFGLKWECC